LLTAAASANTLKEVLDLTQNIVKDIDSAAKFDNKQINEAYNLVKDDMEWFDYVGIPSIKDEIRKSHEGVLKIASHI
jgi:hypothetical protein